MVYCALAGEDDAALAAAPYQVLEEWQKDYDGNLRIVLPDTIGSKGFFANAPEWIARWTGVRVDSGDPFDAAEAAIAFWQRHGQDVSQKRIIFSDGLDIELIEALHARYADRVKVSYGWGTLLTNDFRGLAPDDRLAPFSLVCKAVSADGHPCVKLSDNPNKATGPAEEIARYKRVFGVGEQAARDVVV